MKDQRDRLQILREYVGGDWERPSVPTTISLASGIVKVITEEFQFLRDEIRSLQKQLEELRGDKA